MSEASEQSWSTAVLVIDEEENTVLIKNEKKPKPHYWKAPGGRKHPGETPEETALREVREETGVAPEKVRLVSIKKAPSHDTYFYLAHVPSVAGHKERGNDGEKVATFRLAELLGMMDFFPRHRGVYEETLSSF